MAIDAIVLDRFFFNCETTCHCLINNLDGKSPLGQHWTFEAEQF